MLYSALIFGLLGSFHCVGMCGPIAFLLPLDRKDKTKSTLQLLSYHLGRITMYGFLGLLFGIVGKSLNLFGFQQQLSIGIGVLMILTISIPQKLFNRYNFSKPIYRLVSKVKHKMGNELKKKDPGTFFTIGYLNALLPCGLVYMAIFGAMATGETWEGSLYMIIFWTRYDPTYDHSNTSWKLFYQNGEATCLESNTHLCHHSWLAIYSKRFGIGDSLPFSFRNDNSRESRFET